MVVGGELTMDPRTRAITTTTITSNITVTSSSSQNTTGISKITTSNSHITVTFLHLDKGAATQARAPGNRPIHYYDEY